MHKTHVPQSKPQTIVTTDHLESVLQPLSCGVTRWRQLPRTTATWSLPSLTRRTTWPGSWRRWGWRTRARSSTLGASRSSGSTGRGRFGPTCKHLCFRAKDFDAIDWNWITLIGNSLQTLFYAQSVQLICHSMGLVNWHAIQRASYYQLITMD